MLGEWATFLVCKTALEVWRVAKPGGECEHTVQQKRRLQSLLPIFGTGSGVHESVFFEEFGLVDDGYERMDFLEKEDETMRNINVLEGLGTIIPVVAYISFKTSYGR